MSAQGQTPAGEDEGLLLGDGEGNLFDATWSRSRKHVIVTVAPRGDYDRAAQVLLTPDRLEELRKFLDNTRAD